MNHTEALLAAKTLYVDLATKRYREALEAWTESNRTHRSRDTQFNIQKTERLKHALARATEDAEAIFSDATQREVVGSVEPSGRVELVTIEHDGFGHVIVHRRGQPSETIPSELPDEHLQEAKAYLVRSCGSYGQIVLEELKRLERFQNILQKLPE